MSFLTFIRDKVRVGVSSQYTLTMPASPPSSGGALFSDTSNQLAWGGVLNASGHLRLAAGTELTISSGAVTVTRNIHTIDTQSDAATDDLVTITTGTNVGEGSVLYLRAAHTARTVVVKHGSGNVSLTEGRDVALDDNTKTLVLIYDGTGWVEARPAAETVLQVVAAPHGTVATSASTTYADTGLTASITPRSTSSKVLALVQQAGVVAYDVAGGASATGMDLRLNRAGSGVGAILLEGANSTAGPSGGRTVSASILDSPASSSAGVYKTEYRVSTGGDSDSRGRVQHNSSVSSIALVEIAG